MSEDPEPPDALRPNVAAPAPGGVTNAHTTDDLSSPRLDQALAEFVAFYRKAVPSLVAFLRWQGAPLPDAAECVQEALTRALPRWGTIRCPHAWCRRVASRLYARRVASLEEPVEDVEAVGSPLLAPGMDLDTVEQRHSVLRVLDRLPSRQRQVMAWTYDGATPSEIATELQITPDAVRSNLKKARAALREHLKKRGEIG